MTENAFFAMMARMKYIDRWALMRNISHENLSSHSLDTAMIAHALCLISNRRYGTSYDAQRAAVLAMYHDCGEIITGDLPTPVKYFNSEIKNAYRKVEQSAREELLAMLPADLWEDYAGILSPDGADGELRPLIKAADKLSALVKCIEERKMGNSEFSDAEISVRESVENTGIAAVDDFLRDFIPAYAMTLDRQGGGVK